MNRRTDLLIGAIVMALGIFWAVMASTIKAFDMPGAPGPRFFPYLISAVVVLLGCWLTVTTYFRPPAADEPAAGRGTGKAPEGSGSGLSETWAVIGTFGLLIGYTLGVEYAGFLVSTIVVLIVVMRWLMGLRSWPRICAVGVGLGVVIYAIFGMLLKVPLPAGFLI